MCLRSSPRRTVRRDRRADLFVGQPPMQIVHRGDRLAAEGDDDIAVEHAGGRRRTVRLDRRDQHARRDREAVGAGDGARNRHVLPRDADVTAANRAVAHQA